MAINDVFNKAVASRINGDKNHGWGVDDSLFVIEALYIDNTGEEKLDDELRKHLREVINPSQFRQKLESAKLLNETPKRAKRESLIKQYAE